MLRRWLLGNGQTLLVALGLAACALPASAPRATAGDPPRILLLTHSAGYVHDVVRRPAPSVLALAEQRFVAAAGARFDVVASQDCAELARLSEYDAVVFYTSGELPVPAETSAALVDWVQAGGAFTGVHSAADTLYASPRYGRMLGGVFDGHPWHEEVRARVEFPQHPAVAHLGTALEITDEIYQFRAFDEEPLTVLLSLDTSSVDATRGSRADGRYALAWCREWGRGRVFYTALGHGPEAWADERFLTHLVEGVAWTLAGGPVERSAAEGERASARAPTANGAASTSASVHRASTRPARPARSSRARA